MTFTALIVAIALAGILFLIAAVRRFTQRRVGGGLTCSLLAVILLAFSACALLIAANLRTYQRLTAEQPAGELQLSRMGERQYTAVLAYPDGRRESFVLRGDEWQIDARVLKWHAFANLIGFDAAYRLERIGGRYSRVEDEVANPRTVYGLNAAQRIDPWELLHRYHAYLPWADALYGSATFLPMADGALYAITVSQSGLIARPLNQAAREAVGSWRSP